MFQDVLKKRAKYAKIDLIITLFIIGVAAIIMIINRGSKLPQVILMLLVVYNIFKGFLFNQRLGQKHEKPKSKKPRKDSNEVILNKDEYRVIE